MQSLCPNSGSLLGPESPVDAVSTFRKSSKKSVCAKMQQLARKKLGVNE